MLGSGNGEILLGFSRKTGRRAEVTVSSRLCTRAAGIRHGSFAGDRVRAWTVNIINLSCTPVNGAVVCMLSPMNERTQQVGEIPGISEPPGERDTPVACGWRDDLLRGRPLGRLRVYSPHTRRENAQQALREYARGSGCRRFSTRVPGLMRRTSIYLFPFFGPGPEIPGQVTFCKKSILCPSYD